MSKEVQRLFEIVEQKRLTIAEVSNMLQIPRDRINNWKYKRGLPKKEDLEIIKAWLRKYSDAETIIVPAQRETDVPELKALMDSMLDHYCTNLAQLQNRSALEIQKEILQTAMQKLKQS